MAARGKVAAWLEKGAAFVGALTGLNGDNGAALLENGRGPDNTLLDG